MSYIKVNREELVHCCNGFIDRRKSKIKKCKHEDITPERPRKAALLRDMAMCGLEINLSSDDFKMLQCELKTSELMSMCQNER